MTAPDSGPARPLRRKGSRGCAPEKKEQFGPTRVRAPMVMGRLSMNVQFELMYTPLPSLYHAKHSILINQSINQSIRCTSRNNARVWINESSVHYVEPVVYFNRRIYPRFIFQYNIIFLGTCSGCWKWSAVVCYIFPKLDEPSS